MVHREIADYHTVPVSQLYVSLCHITNELCKNYDQLGFLRSQELEAKRTGWNSDPQASTQLRDRLAAYGASSIICEIVQVETKIQALNAERSLVERLIDHAG